MRSYKLTESKSFQEFMIQSVSKKQHQNHKNEKKDKNLLSVEGRRELEIEMEKEDGKDMEKR